MIQYKKLIGGGWLKVGPIVAMWHRWRNSPAIALKVKIWQIVLISKNWMPSRSWR